MNWKRIKVLLSSHSTWSRTIHAPGPEDGSSKCCYACRLTLDSNLPMALLAALRGFALLSCFWPTKSNGGPQKGQFLQVLVGAFTNKWKDNQCKDRVKESEEGWYDENWTRRHLEREEINYKCMFKMRVGVDHNGEHSTWKYSIIWYTSLKTMHVQYYTCARPVPTLRSYTQSRYHDSTFSILWSTP